MPKLSNLNSFSDFSDRPIKKSPHIALALAELLYCSMLSASNNIKQYSVCPFPAFFAPPGLPFPS
jgi:hypothetical protein